MLTRLDDVLLLKPQEILVMTGINDFADAGRSTAYLVPVSVITVLEPATETQPLLFGIYRCDEIA